MFHFDDYDIKDFDDYAIEELTEIVKELKLIASVYEFGTEEFSFFVGLADRIEKPLEIRKENKVNNNFEQLRENVEKWAEDKDLLHEENAEKQFMKFIEEVFEFKTEMDNILSYNDPYVDEAVDRMKLELGDVMVTLIILSKQLNIDIVECLQLAYDKISKRKGVTKNGIFVKEEDLQ